MIIISTQNQQLTTKVIKPADAVNESLESFGKGNVKKRISSIELNRKEASQHRQRYLRSRDLISYVFLNTRSQVITSSRKPPNKKKKKKKQKLTTVSSSVIGCDSHTNMLLAVSRYCSGSDSRTRMDKRTNERTTVRQSSGPKQVRGKYLSRSSSFQIADLSFYPAPKSHQTVRRVRRASPDHRECRSTPIRTCLILIPISNFN